MRYLAALLLISLGISSMAEAQGRYLQLAIQHASSKIYHESFTVPGDQRNHLVVAFRIPNDRLVFMKDRQATANEEYIASFEAVVHLFEGRRAIESRRLKAEHHAATFDDTRSRLLDFEGSVVFDVPPGEYRYHIEIIDVNADRSQRTEPATATVPVSAPVSILPPFAVGEPVFADGSATVRLVNLGGDVPYGGDFSFLIPLVVPENAAEASPAVTYSIVPAEATSRRERRMARVPAQETPEPAALSGSIAASALRQVGPLGTGERLTGTLAFSAEENSRVYMAVVPVPAGSLPNGTYEITVTLRYDGASEHANATFATHWRNMPVSLYDLDVAINNLGFIEERHVVRAMLRGSREDRERAFMEYWNSRDPDPETEFNELMAEYYRRIDHAAHAFRTGTEPVPDGLTTDRARIYILHGEPVEITRDLPGQGAGVRETWRYDDGRTFVFEASTSLDKFRLVQSS